MKPPFILAGLPLIFEMEGPAAVTAHCLMHGLRLVSCGAPANDVEFAQSVELDGQWFTTEPATRTLRRKMNKERHGP